MTKLFRYLKPYTAAIITVLILMTLHSLADLYLPSLMAEMVNEGILGGNTSLILHKGAIMLAIAGASVVCAIIAQFFSSRTQSGFSRRVRELLFSRAENFSASEFDHFGSASLITRTTSDVVQVQQIVGVMLTMMLRAPVMCIGGIFMALSHDVPLSLVFTVTIPALVLTIVIIMKQAFPLFSMVQLKLEKLTLIIREKLTGIREIRAFDKDRYECERFARANEDLAHTAIRVATIMSAGMPIMLFIMNSSIVALLYFGAVRVDAGALAIGDVMAFTQYAQMILFSLMMLTMLFVLLPRGEVSAQRIQEVLNFSSTLQVPQITESAFDAAAEMLPPPSVSTAFFTDPVRGEKTPVNSLEFRDISFTYPGSHNPALAKISFHVKKGEVLAIIGSTGSGKSTLVNLIPRLYDASFGTILINGEDHRNIPIDTLRGAIGFVPQKSLLFSGTIAENIAFGHGSFDREKILEALQTAQASEFVQSREGALDAMLSQGGTTLSGGQKQRLSIARALIRKPEILIFDDSFSALDFKTDAALRGALSKSARECITIIIAQRISTVMSADRILVLDDGALAAIGTHRELLKSSSIYREIALSQLSEEEIA